MTGGRLSLKLITEEHVKVELKDVRQGLYEKSWNLDI